MRQNLKLSLCLDILFFRYAKYCKFFCATTFIKNIVSELQLNTIIARDNQAHFQRQKLS